MNNDFKYETTKERDERLGKQEALIELTRRAIELNPHNPEFQEQLRNSLSKRVLTRITDHVLDELFILYNDAGGDIRPLDLIPVDRLLRELQGYPYKLSQMKSSPSTIFIDFKYPNKDTVVTVKYYGEHFSVKFNNKLSGGTFTIRWDWNKSRRCIDLLTGVIKTMLDNSIYTM